MLLLPILPPTQQIFISRRAFLEGQAGILLLADGCVCRGCAATAQDVHLLSADVRDGIGRAYPVGVGAAILAVWLGGDERWLGFLTGGMGGRDGWRGRVHLGQNAVHGGLGLLTQVSRSSIAVAGSSRACTLRDVSEGSMSSRFGCWR